MDLMLAIGRFFVNPVLYIALLAAVLLGYYRVKKERRIFRIRIVYGLTEFKRLIKDGWLYALVFSVLFTGIGLVVPMHWLIALSLVSIVLMATTFYPAGSFIYLAAAAVGLSWLFNANGWSLNFGFFEFEGAAFAYQWLIPVALIAGALVFAEGKMIDKAAAEAASPRLHKSGRGLKAAAYISKRLWLLPILLVVPGALLDSYAPYWPQLSIGETSFSLILFPFVFGFQGRSQRTLPVYLYPLIGKAVSTLGVSIVVVGLAALLWQPLAAIALIVGVIGRIAITVHFALKERSGNYAVTPQSQGVMIVDVLPGSPADKMGLLRGEVIRKVNGIAISNESELYEAIQVNAAHCRLEVLDHNLEVRLRQHVIFRHDHHRLGLLVVN
ncbi:PDZ domain-containing protein [Planococcus sp. CPCC 101016]|uniref:PDZ domain-containing protein n=1 Tax=Planococcus sp. CPCC 101016 TaxID=2599617 RepID=UPI0011B4DBD7|nr:PDZ domain-containing protein [Planococcus sp. CPCC 101016]TWT08571.1 PDZ domain-containing protein [Planococcus sp. CPCC 101016]